MPWEADCIVFYVSGRPRAAQLYVFYLSGRLPGARALTALTPRVGPLKKDLTRVCGLGESGRRLAAVWEASGRVLGGSGRRLGCSASLWADLGGSGRRLGGVWEASGSVSEASGSVSEESRSMGGARVSTTANAFLSHARPRWVGGLLFIINIIYYY